jgi:hypothetical protein
VIHGTASDTEFTILETLKLILMELLKVSDDYEEVVKERAAAAAERAAASEERLAAAAERQAIRLLLERSCSLQTKSTTTLTKSASDAQAYSPDQVGFALQQKGHDSVIGIATAQDNQIFCQDGMSDRNDVEDSFANVDEDVSRNDRSDSMCRNTVESIQSTHYHWRSEVKDSGWSGVKINHDDQSLQVANAGEDISTSHMFVEVLEEQEIMHSASIYMPMRAEPTFAYLHTVKQSTCDFDLPAGRMDMNDLQFKELDTLSPTSAHISVQASPVQWIQCVV